MFKKHVCVSCKYSTDSKKDWNKHNKTIKHIKMGNIDTLQWQCPTCLILFGSRTSLWRHTKTCKELEEKKEELSDTLSQGIITAIQENTRLQLEMISQNKSIMDSHNNIIIGNNNNNSIININMFLNEECGNAMSIQNFAKRLSMTIDDLRSNKKNSIANIVIKNLKPLSVTERPVHYKDNREWYIKDEKGGWNEDSGESLLAAAAFGIQINWQREFELQYPGWINNTKLRDMYIELAGTSSADIPDVDKMKILNEIGGEVKLMKYIL
jgi:hypothetical protein